jgi:hypothetical protein
LKITAAIRSLLLLGLLSAPVTHAEPPRNVEIEVNFLLGYIEGSGCAFYRNGTWYDSKTARAHLRDKYDYLTARSLIDTTEDFIERAATASSLSGQAYEVSCNGGAAVPSSQWLSTGLTHFRAFQ